MPADRALLERLLTQTGVERDPAPPQSSYLAELYRTLMQALMELVERGSQALRVDRDVLLWIVVALAALVLALAARALLPRLRRRSQAAGAPEVVRHDLPPVDWDAAAWRAELERCLAEERLRDALRAAWWWLARSVAGAQVAPDWTSRELLARTPRMRRRDLRDLLLRLDVLTYGADRPGLADLRRVAEEIEQMAPPPGGVA